MAYEPVEVLEIRAWGQTVGAVIPGGRAAVFEYDPSWKRRGIELAPILMPLASVERTMSFPALNAETFHGLPPMLADSVPDRFGNGLINARLAREGLLPSQVGALDRLAYVGRRGMGALEYVPDRGPRNVDPTPVELESLVVAARKAVNGTLDEDGVEEGVNQLLSVGTSAGGARAKAVLAWDRSTNEMRAGNLPVPPRFEQWLLKFDGVGNDQPAHLGNPLGYGRIEYAYSLMAADAGIDMAESHLLVEGGRAHFMTKRFDRIGERRLHMQSLCALGGIDFNQDHAHDYASLFTHVDHLGLGEDAKVEAYRRMVFNVLAANNDDHSKNFSFLMDETGAWSLSPAYDVTYAYEKDHRWLGEHLMGIGGKFDDFTRADLLDYADRFEVPGARDVITRIEGVVADWPRYAEQADVSDDWRTAVAARLTQVRLGK